MKWSQVKWASEAEKNRKSGHKWGKPLFKHVQTSHTTPHPLLTNRARLQRIWSLDPGHQHRLPNFISCSGVLVMIQQISTNFNNPTWSGDLTQWYKHIQTVSCRVSIRWSFCKCNSTADLAGPKSEKHWETALWNCNEVLLLLLGQSAKLGTETIY